MQYGKDYYYRAHPEDLRKFYGMVDEFHRMWDVVTEFDSLSSLASQLLPSKCGIERKGAEYRESNRLFQGARGSFNGWLAACGCGCGCEGTGPMWLGVLEWS